MFGSPVEALVQISKQRALCAKDIASFYELRDFGRLSLGEEAILRREVGCPVARVAEYRDERLLRGLHIRAGRGSEILRERGKAAQHVAGASNTEIAGFDLLSRRHGHGASRRSLFGQILKLCSRQTQRATRAHRDGVELVDGGLIRIPSRRADGSRGAKSSKRERGRRQERTHLCQAAR